MHLSVGPTNAPNPGAFRFRKNIVVRAPGKKLIGCKFADAAAALTSFA
jgi:hypothetical protein